MNAVLQRADEPFKIIIDKIEWLLPSVTFSDARISTLLKYIKKDPLIPISFCSWGLYEYPMLPITSNHVWTVKTSTQLEKPRFVILEFQTNRKNVFRRNASHFDHCKVTNAKLFFNNQTYPYGNLHLDFDKKQYALLYEMYTNFQVNCYGRESQPYLSKNDCLEFSPLIVIDCSKQNESLEFEAKRKFPCSKCCILFNYE